jgi:hypothetical protein
VLVHSPSRSLLLKSRNPAAIKNILPKWKEIDVDGHNLAVPHRDDEVRILRNLGVKAPPPILHYYDWPIAFGRTPFRHQKETAAFCTLHPRCFVLNEPGTAKTVSVLWAADWLMRQGLVRKVLIVAPLSTLDLVWANEIFGTLMHRSAPCCTARARAAWSCWATTSTSTSSTITGWTSSRRTSSNAATSTW